MMVEIQSALGYLGTLKPRECPFQIGSTRYRKTISEILWCVSFRSDSRPLGISYLSGMFSVSSIAVIGDNPNIYAVGSNQRPDNLQPSLSD